MSEMTNKTIAVVANEKNEMHKSIFDDELFNDVSSYDSNELHCGIGISMEFSYYKDKGYIKKGDSICIVIQAANDALCDEDYEKCIELYDMAGGIEVLSEASDLNNYAWSCCMTGQYDKAVESALKALELDCSGAILDTIATAYEGLGRYDEALKYYEQSRDAYLADEDEDSAESESEKIKALQEKK